MNLYSYDGPVLELDKVIANRWLGFTYAESEEIARYNLVCQFKKQFHRVPRSEISVPGALTIIEGEVES